jgi:hypothetical protein
MNRVSRPPRRRVSSFAAIAPSTGGGARRAIEWSALDADVLGERGRKIVGATWRERMRQEHLAVGAFSLVARELADLGCSANVLALITRAACDEVRHAEICREFAVALLGPVDVPRQYRGLPKVPMHAGASSSARVLFHVVEMCCLSETTTGVYFTEMLARTTDPIARVAIESLLEDEIDHGRVGWAYLAERNREKSVSGLAEALPAMLERTLRGVPDGAYRESAEDAALERCGYLGPAASGEVYRRALHGVILPGFEVMGLDLRPAKGWLKERGW